MASPQLENGHTRIANEILEAFCRIFPPNGSSARVLLAIIRKTYGWNKKEDQISISQIETMTGLSRRAVIYAIQNLEAQRFITVQRQRGRGNVNQVNTVAVQKNYDLWVVQRISDQWAKQLQNKREKYQAGVVQRKSGGSAENGKKVVQRIGGGSADSLHPQKTITKDNTKENMYIVIFNHWNQQNIVFHKKLTDDVRSMIVRALRNYSTEEVKSAISNYAEIIHGEQYFFKYKWTLKDFLKRGIEKFTNLEIAKSNFLKEGNNGNDGKNKGRRLPNPKEYEPTADYPDV